MIRRNQYPLILLSFCLLLFACDKNAHFDGTVLSRHGVPVPNAEVQILLGHGEHKSGGGDPLQGKTDAFGKFKIQSKVCNTCRGVEISAHTTDSGYVEHQEITTTSNIVVVLK